MKGVLDDIGHPLPFAFKIAPAIEIGELPQQLFDMGNFIHAFRQVRPYPPDFPVGPKQRIVVTPNPLGPWNP